MTGFVCVFLALMALDSTKFGKNVKLFREYLGLSQKTLAELLQISKRSIAYIEAGHSSLKKNTVNKFLDLFFMYNASDLGERTLKVPKHFKEDLLKFHEQKNPHYVILLAMKPSIPYAIKHKLLTSDFLNRPKETKYIRRFFQTHGWDYDSDTLSRALNRKNKLLKIEPHPKKKNTFLYSKRLD